MQHDGPSVVRSADGSLSTQPKQVVEGLERGRMVSEARQEAIKANAADFNDLRVDPGIKLVYFGIWAALIPADLQSSSKDVTPRKCSRSACVVVQVSQALQSMGFTHGEFGGGSRKLNPPAECVLAIRYCRFQGHKAFGRDRVRVGKGYSALFTDAGKRFKRGYRLYA